jgi:hypothetical protein
MTITLAEAITLSIFTAIGIGACVTTVVFVLAVAMTFRSDRRRRERADLELLRGYRSPRPVVTPLPSRKNAPAVLRTPGRSTNRSHHSHGHREF